MAIKFKVSRDIEGQYPFLFKAYYYPLVKEIEYYVVVEDPHTVVIYPEAELRRAIMEGYSLTNIKPVTRPKKNEWIINPLPALRLIGGGSLTDPSIGVVFDNSRDQFSISSLEEDSWTRELELKISAVICEFFKSISKNMLNFNE